MTTKIFTLAMIGWFLAATGCGVPEWPVVVVFGNVGTEASPQYCPVGVMRTDNECDVLPYTGKPIDYVCRFPEDVPPGKSANQRHVFWSSDISTNGNPSLLFNIEFKDKLNPCQNTLPPNPAATKFCNAKKRGDMTFSGTPPEARFKYSVTAPDCETLDPYIVFR